MSSISVTDAVFQAARSWLKLEALWNIALAKVTDARFQAPRFWLNAVAKLNMSPVSCTRAVFQAARFWLNAVAERKVPSNSLTDATFHFPMSALNVGLPYTSRYMLVTLATFQSPIGPYVSVAVVGLVAYSETAVKMLVFVMGVTPKALGESTRNSVVMAYIDDAVATCITA